MVDKVFYHYILHRFQKSVKFFFFVTKMVKPESIKDTDLTPGWRYIPRIDPLLGIQMSRKQ